MLVALAAACAQPGMPPGGPPDREPPRIVGITPDTNSVDVRATSVTFQFDEVVSERPQGKPTLADLFQVSPSTGPVGISWRRTSVTVTPDGGLRPNTTYTIRMLPGMVDLSSNMDSTGIEVVFSTGPTIAAGSIRGRVFDWVAAAPAAKTYVAAISLPDSAIWSATADSTGLFVIEHIPPGTYTVQAIVDQNGNRVADGRELFDSITVALVDSFRRDMLVAIRDSLGPGIANIDPRDSLLYRVTFDRPVDTGFVAQPSNFILKKADSTVAAIAAVETQADLDRRAADSARTRAVQDSVRRAFVADSIRAADSANVAAAPPARPTGRRPGAPTRPPAAAEPDTATAPPPRPTVAIPVTTWYLRLAQPLTPDTLYRLRAEDIRSITGATRSSERVFRTPKAVAKPDTTVRPDTGRGPGA